MDGVLELLGWYGKTFESADSVRPLLFRTRSGTLVSLDPRFMPVAFVLIPVAGTAELVWDSQGLADVIPLH